MHPSQLLEEFNAKLTALFAKSPAPDIEKNGRAAIAGVLTRLDLVTREEFDVQCELLKRSREKLAQLELKLAVLERTESNPSRD
ncbi:MAG: accessory factor UbiK family protein [Betaproteobacteria bacterium]